MMLTTHARHGSIFVSLILLVYDLMSAEPIKYASPLQLLHTLVPPPRVPTLVTTTMIKGFPVDTT